MSEPRALAALTGLSIWDPIHLCIDEAGHAVKVLFIERNMLLGGEPGAGKSNALNLITAHAALSPDCRLVLIDGNQVGLGMWRHCAEAFVGPSITDAITTLQTLRDEMDRRYEWLLAHNRRKINRTDPFTVIVVVIDELAYFTATVGKKTEQEAFSTLARDLVQRGRAAGVVMVVATQRPTAKVVPTELRDLFGYRWAFRCTTDTSSDVILGDGWSNRGYTATDIDPLARGVGWLLAEGGGIPRRVKAAYLSDEQILDLAAIAARLRHMTMPDDPGTVAA